MSSDTIKPSQTFQASTHVIERRTCRVCDSPKLEFLYALGDLYISTFVDKNVTSPKAPLEMVMCPHCSLVQLKHTAPQELLYSGFYWYRSGVTETMRLALRDVTSKIENLIPLVAGDVVMDIGSNDGTLLRTYEVPGLVTVGVEPATNLSQEGKKGLSHFINDFWSIEAYTKAVPQKARVITAIGMFYDMEDPNQFIRDAVSAMRPDGVFVCQLMCLKNMMDTNDVGNICHEHLEFYSLESLDFLLHKNGLEVFDMEHNEVNGGSYRLYCKKRGAAVAASLGAAERVKAYRDSERGLETKKSHLEFFHRVEANKKKCLDFIQSEVKKEKRVWIYGASTKGNTILQYYGLDHRWIQGASERSPEKWGKFTVGTGIPIFSEEEARRAKPDYFLVLPYAFFEEFYKREKEWRDGGGKFLVPIPEFRVVS